LADASLSPAVPTEVTIDLLATTKAISTALGHAADSG